MISRRIGEDILRIFRQAHASFVSGEELSRELGVTRAAVWKQITQLRQLGYVIEAFPSKGYRLAASPDALIPSEIRAGLETQIVGRDIVFFDEADSTNLRARELGDGMAPEGMVVIADSQHAGKGRMGRTWVSPPGVNLYATILLRPPILPFDAPQLTFLSAVAVAQAVEDVTPLTPQLKWPNDILVNGMKVAGLLNEMDAEIDKVRYVLLGIGVNINMEHTQFPDRLRYPATSLSIQSGTQVSRLKFVRSLLMHLDLLYDSYLKGGFSSIRGLWEKYCALVGHSVEVDFNDHVARGIYEGIDSDGALLLRTTGGLERILAGDVRPL